MDDSQDVINGPDELREWIAECVRCNVPLYDAHATDMFAAIMAADHPAWGADWKQWFRVTEDRRWSNPVQPLAGAD